MKKPKSKDPIFPDDEPPSMSSSSSSAQPPKPRVKIVQRYNHPEKKSAYIKYNDVHFVGCSLKASSQYLDILEIMEKELIDGSLNPDKRACKDRLGVLQQEHKSNT